MLAQFGDLDEAPLEMWVGCFTAFALLVGGIVWIVLFVVRERKPPDADEVRRGFDVTRRKPPDRE